MPASTATSIHIFEAHGILGCIAWAVLAPVGAITIRLVPSTKAWIIHGGIMLFALLAFTSNVGIGIARILEAKADIGRSAHFIIGTVLFALAWLQPFIGTAHHFLYKATGKRTLLSALHVFFGRLFMLVGVINGGVGLLIAKNSSRAENIAYGTLVGIVWTAYVIVSLQMEVNRQEKGKIILKETRSSSDREGSPIPVETNVEMKI